MAVPTSGFVNRIVCAEELSSTSDHDITSGGVVNACLFCVRIGAGADKIALADKGSDVGSVPVVALDKGCVGLAWLSVGEENTAAQ